ncbi:ABC transporter substrate-binding protein [Microaerobacter geothermalis]|uniref:ABC transporter substrate-binding protein n=1 Tax=Microaerobacter geothermalis TaxID=674972 RepID=UPI001F38D52E|nr:ABC transporter substrate-binding protein [Microaerobacter geothermalis]MCF6093863.1 ABC transporter substrate-binding protein [Microaerobacter geothermalis]
MKNFKVGLILFLGLVFLTLLTGCGKSEKANTNSSSSQESTAQSQSKEKIVSSKDYNENATVIVGIKGGLLSLDPANYRDRVTESVLRNIFDGLVTRNAKGEVQPLVAESWENPSPTEWIFNIRKGVKFHDGTPLTADDVKFTFDRIITEGGLGGETSPRKGLLGPLKEVQKIDDYRVKFILEEPWPILLKMLPHQQIVPKAYIERVGDKAFAEKPIGAGPFKLVEAKLDERIVLERFDDYYGGSPEMEPVGPAKIKTLVFDVIPEVTTRISALKRGEIQRVHALSPTLVTQLKNDPNIEVKMVDGTRVFMLEMNTKKPPFDNVKVRQAMNYAIDMDTIVEKVLEGYATRLAGPLLANGFGTNPDLKPYPYDPEKAKQLLAEAGYPNGFQLVIDTDQNNREVAEAAAASLRKVGIDANTRVWDFGVLKPLLLNGERQMVMTDWGNSTQDPFDLLNPTIKTNGRGNYSLYSNPRVDELLSKADVELDVEKRKQLYYEAQQIIYEDAPWVFGYQLKEIEAGVKDLQGWEPSADGMLYMPDAYMVK